MSAATLNTEQERIIQDIPAIGDFTNIYFYTDRSMLDAEYISILDRVVGLSDSVLSKWLNITPRTLRNYKKNSTPVLKANIKEHIILILSLYKHGIGVFGSKDDFEEWLSKKNYLLDGRVPIDFLDTVSGIKFIDNRLTAMEFGENV